ncbi:hypothetical protein LEP1GSC016_2862 [Leptospira borgpetersenii serovar Hardjo-bovis str. Sponselee]|uniref:Uncharacterized protein n=1 Tax=Leptospira borgpetersenii serovar Hardjo-bovis str. Sponselee TaxID=1303729 RepID=M6BWH2_LEPBO|nr:hypothetical protein LEP1GSC016_2862 [Leptospira borgpetersenii serovar Hardjo-bovis str. Sponselee]
MTLAATSISLNFWKDLGLVPKPFDLIGILADRCNCSYVLGQTLNRLGQSICL